MPRTVHADKMNPFKQDDFAVYPFKRVVQLLKLVGETFTVGWTHFRRVLTNRIFVGSWGTTAAIT